MLIENVKSLNNELHESYNHGDFTKIAYTRVGLNSERPDTKSDKKLVYKFTLDLRFRYDKEYKNLDDLRSKVLSGIIRSQRHKQEFADHFKMETYFSKYHGDHKFYEINFKENTLSKPKINPYGGDWGCDIDLEVTFDYPAWWEDNITHSFTSKEFFFKNYKVKYKKDLPYIIHRRTIGWKEKSIESIEYAIKNKSKLKQYLKELTQLPFNTSADYDIKLNVSSNEIKIVVVRGAVKFLSKFGIPPRWAKYLLAGLTIYGILKLMKGKDDKYKEAKAKFNRFL